MSKHIISVKNAVLAVLVTGSSTCLATNGDQMLGVTATQWGMGGAITAAPQDAGTVLTNPAGLAVIEMNEFRSDMGFGFMNPPRKVSGVSSDSDLYMIPSGSIALRVNENMTFGMGMAGLSGMGVDFADISPLPGNQPVVTTKQFFKIAPGFAYRLNDSLSLGAALNIDYQSLAMYNTNFQLPQNQAYGFGASLGAIYKMNDRIQFGFAYISEQDMQAFKWNTIAGEYEMTMNAPEQYSLGVAFTPNDDLLIEFDIKQIMFSSVLDTVDLKTPGGTMPMKFGWSDQTVYSLGLQQKLSDKTTVRAGYNYGASPIDEEDVMNNIGSLAVTEHHWSLGATRQLGQKLFGSISYVKAVHNKIQSDVMPVSIELEQNVINLQITYRN